MINKLIFFLWVGSKKGQGYKINMPPLFIIYFRGMPSLKWINSIFNTQSKPILWHWCFIFIFMIVFVYSEIYLLSLIYKLVVTIQNKPNNGSTHYIWKKRVYNQILANFLRTMLCRHLSINRNCFMYLNHLININKKIVCDF